MVAETCFLLKRSGFDPALALQLIERGVVQLPFVLQEQIGSVCSLFQRYERVPTPLADAALIRLAEINDSPLLLSTDSDVHVDRRHGRQTIPLISRDCWPSCCRCKGLLWALPMETRHIESCRTPHARDQRARRAPHGVSRKHGRLTGGWGS